MLSKIDWTLWPFTGGRISNVNCVSPGGVFNNQSLKFVNKYIKRVPMKRMAYPSDISPAIAFLLSDNAKYVNGQNLIIDGGLTSI